MVYFRVMQIPDYDGVYNFWITTSGMGLNSTNDSRKLVKWQK